MLGIDFDCVDIRRITGQGYLHVPDVRNLSGRDVARKQNAPRRRWMVGRHGGYGLICMPHDTMSYTQFTLSRLRLTAACAVSRRSDWSDSMPGRDRRGRGVLRGPSFSVVVKELSA